MHIARERLHNQLLASPPVTTPADVVRHLGAVQAQEFPLAKWALGLRIAGATDSLIEDAFARGDILRTHVLRPTWHFVTPSDIRWMLGLSGPRVLTTYASYYRKLELDGATLRRAMRVLERLLRGGRHLTRAPIRAAFAKAGIAVDSMRFGFILLHAEFEALICSGPRAGKQFTYALLEERVPPAPMRSREDSLSELTRRYFSSHGPAQLTDFIWWSGLRTADARAGIEMLGTHLVRESIDGATYWFAPPAGVPRPASRAAYLLPIYDEYLIAYKDRSASYVPPSATQRRPDNIAFTSPLVLGGRVAGTWRRAQAADGAVHVAVQPFAPLGPTARRAIGRAAAHYAAFLGQPVRVTGMELAPRQDGGHDAAARTGHRDRRPAAGAPRG